MPKVGYAQCPIQASADKLTIQCGDTVILKAFAAPQDYLINNNFNSTANQPGNGWETSPSATYTNPCGPPISGGLTYMWMGNAADVPRELKTVAFDLTTGGYIKFDLRYAIQAENSPCEGPDLPEEGVFLQYSVNNSPWQTIKYFDTKDGVDPIMTTWNTYQFNIPAAACNPNAKIRWIQVNSSGQEFDNWGLDNIQIVRNSPEYLFDWQHDPYDPTLTGLTPGVYPYSDTSYTVKYYNKNNPSEFCSGTINIHTIMPEATVISNKTQACEDQDIELQILPNFYALNPQTCGTGSSNCDNGNSGTFNIGVNPIVEPGNGYYNPLGTITSTVCNCTNGVGNCDKSFKTQFIINKNELPSYFRGGQLNSLSFTVNNLGTSTNYTNFIVKLGCTSLESYNSTSDIVASLYTVFNGAKTLINGKNQIFFSSLFNWTGDENIVVEISWSGTSYRSGNLTKMQTQQNQTLVVKGCTNTSLNDISNAQLFRYRPIISLTACYYPVQPLVYEWTPKTILSNSSVANPTAQISQTTTFTAKVSIVGKPNCKVQRQITIVKIAANASILSNRKRICDYKDSLQLNISTKPSTTGGSIESIVWTPNININNTNIPNPIVKPSQNTTYYCTVTDNLGCKSIDSIPITIQATLSPFLTNNAPVCLGDTLILTTPNIKDATYKWSGPNGYTSTVSSPILITSDSLASGFYKSEITYNGCIGKADSIYALVKASKTSSISYPNTVYCKSSINPIPAKNMAGLFTAVPSGLVFKNTASGEINLENSLPGKYAIYFTPSDTTCTISSSQVVEIKSAYNPSFSYPSPLCAGTGIIIPTTNDTSLNHFEVIEGDSAALTFLNRKKGIIDLQNTLPGTYTIQNSIPNGTGCSVGSHTASITIAPIPNASWSGVADKATFCQSDSTQFNLIPNDDGGIFYGKGIINNVFSPFQLPNDSISIVYKIQNSGGCKDSLAKTVYIIANPKPQILGKNLVCLNESYTLTSSIVGSNYVWNGLHKNKTITGRITDTTTFILEISNSLNCKGADTITLFPLPIPKDTIFGDNKVCLGSPLALNATGNFDCLWMPSLSTSDIYIFNSKKSENITLVSTNIYGCKDTLSKFITVNPLPEVGLSIIPDFCKIQDSLLLSHGSPIGGKYLLDGIPTNIIHPILLSTGKHNILYRYTDKNDCSNLAEQHFNVYPMPLKPIASFNGNNCEQDSVFLSTNNISNTIYHWNGPAFIIKPELQNDTSEILIRHITKAYEGWYTLSIEQNNCISPFDSLYLTIKFSPQISVEPTKAEICEDSILYLKSTNVGSPKISSWEWVDLKNPSKVIYKNPEIQFSGTNSTIYQIKGSTVESCSDYKYVEIKVFDYPTIDLEPLYQVCLNDSIELKASSIPNSNYIYAWEPSDKVDKPTQYNPMLHSSTTDTFNVFLNVSNQHCKSQASTIVHAIDCSTNPETQITNAFSPNGDGINDFFIPITEKISNYTFMIFNRWGVKIFESHTPNEGWDGTSNGVLVQDDVYVYLLSGNSLQNKSIKKMGTITITK